MDSTPTPHAAPGWRSYRCPVCGHTDGVELSGDEDTVTCTHCATPLEVVVRGPDDASVAVRVASRWRRRG